MSNINFEPKKLFILTGDEQIRGYVHPVRMSLLQMLGKEKRTISGIARELGVHPANITHHFKLLEKIGLIRLVEKRDTGKNLEKYYRAAAYTYAIAASEERKAATKALALSILQDNLSVAIHSVKDTDNKAVIALLATARIGPDRVVEFIEKLKKTVEEFKTHSTKEGQAYTINVSLYPNEADRLDRLPQEEIQL